jgi:hypothetical protein
MKKNVRNGVALLLAAIAVLALAGCEQEAVETPSGNAEISSITIGGIEVTVPQGTARSEWLLEGFQVSDMELADALIPADQFDASGNFTAGVKVGAKGSGAAIWYLKVSNGLKPDADDPAWSTTAPDVLKNKDYLYIQVTSADKWAQNYYRVRINKVSSDAGIIGLLLGGKNIGLTEEMGSNNITQVTMIESTFVFGRENISVPVEVVKKDTAASVQYGLLKAGSTETEPQWGNESIFSLLDKGDRLYVKVTPSDTSAAPLFYGVLIQTTPRISSVNIGGTSQIISENGTSVVYIMRASQTITDVLQVTKAYGVTVEYDLLGADGTLVYKPLLDSTSVEYTDGCTLYLKAGADGFDPLYHQFKIAVKSNNRTVTSVTINSETATPGTGEGVINVSLGTYFPGFGWWGANTGAATLSTGQAASGPKTITVTMADATAKVTGYAILDDTATAALTDLVETSITKNGAAYSFSISDAITNSQHLYLRVQAETGDIWYHRIVVTVQ